MRSSLASRTPLRGAEWRTQRAVWTATAPALRKPRRARSPCGRRRLRGPGATGLSPLAWGIGAGAEKLGLQRAQAGRRCPPLPVSRREAGLCPAARCWPRSCAERQESGAPRPLFLKSGSWEPAPGLLATPVPRRCGRRDSSGAPNALSGGHLRGREAGAEGSPWSHPSRGGEDREGTPEPPALFARRSGSLHSRPFLFSSQNLSRLRQQDPNARKERKSEGAGALQTPASSQSSCGKTAALLLAERGCEGEVVRGAPALRGVCRGRPRELAPEAAAAPREEREEGPRGAARPAGRAGSSLADLRTLLAS